MRTKLTGQVRLDAAGNGTVTLTAGTSLMVTHTRLRVDPAPGAQAVNKRPRAMVSVAGDELEGTYSGHNDASDTTYEVDGADTIECEWTGGDPGALATVITRGNTV